jgi:hypothetical protein
MAQKAGGPLAGKVEAFCRLPSVKWVRELPMKHLEVAAVPT